MTRLANKANHLRAVLRLGTMVIMMIQDLLTRFAALENIRRPFEDIWQDIDHYVLAKPIKDKTKRVLFDNTAHVALQQFVSVLDSMLTPQGIHWHGLQYTSQEICSEYRDDIGLEQAVCRLFSLRYAPSSNFTAQQHQVYQSLGAYGTAALFVDHDAQGGLRYRHVPIHELYLGQNHTGTIDTIFRSFTLSGDVICQQWNVLQELDKKQSYQIVHAIIPDQEQGRGFVSVYFMPQQHYVLDTQRYRTMPYSIWRYQTLPGQVYGTSPAMMVLADIKMLNEMEKTQLKALHQQVTPPLMVPDDGMVRHITLTPGAINYGGLDMHGKSMIVPISTTGDLGLSEAKIEQKRQQIKEVFLVPYFQMLAQAPGMTAVEVLQRAHEKSTLLAPTLSRLQSQSLATMILRELDLMMCAGQLDYVADLEDLCDITYQSPANHMQQAAKAEGMLRLFDSIAPILAHHPDYIEMIDIPMVIKQLAKGYGVPASIFK